MSEAKTKTKNPLDDGNWVGIICFLLIIGGIGAYVAIHPPTTDNASSPFDPIKVTDKCGEGTFYHPLTNKCQVFRPLQPFVTVDNSEMIAELEKTIRDIHIDLDGNRVVEMDDEGIPVVSCTPYENEQYTINRKCQMTFK